MTALGLLAPRDRARLLERLAELRDLDALMRQPGTLCAPREDRDDTTTEGTEHARAQHGPRDRG